MKSFFREFFPGNTIELHESQVAQMGLYSLYRNPNPIAISKSSLDLKTMRDYGVAFSPNSIFNVYSEFGEKRGDKIFCKVGRLFFRCDVFDRDACRRFMRSAFNRDADDEDGAVFEFDGCNVKYSIHYIDTYIPYGARCCLHIDIATSKYHRPNRYWVAERKDEEFSPHKSPAFETLSDARNYAKSDAVYESNSRGRYERDMEEVQEDLSKDGYLVFTLGNQMESSKAFITTTRIIRPI